MRRLALPLLLLLPLAAQESLFNHPASSNPQDKSNVEAKALFSMPSPGGYLPVRVTVVNQRKSDASLTVRSDSTNGIDDEGSSVESEFRIASEAGKTSVHDLLVPLTTTLSTGGYAYATDSVNVRMSGSFGSNSGSLASSFAPHLPAVLMSEKLYTPNASSIDAELNAGASHRYGGSYEFAARFEPSELPEDWRAYSGYDAMMLTDDDWSHVGAGARNAILQWCRLGAELRVYTVRSTTTFATLGIGTDGPDDANYGYGRVSLHPKLDLTPPSVLSSFSKPTLPPLNVSINDDYSSSWALHGAFGQQAFSYAIFVVVLIAFGILVGPVNLFVFAKSGMRHRLFITTPVISLGASALLILLILVKDGIGGRGQRVTLMEVRPDTGENNAYVLQEQVSRTGVLLGASFSLTESSALSPVPIQDSPWARLSPGRGGGGLRYTVNLDEGDLKVSGDWFQSRSEQGQLVRAVVPTRGRVEIRSTGGTPVLLSTFEFPLDRLYYVDRSGGYWLASDVKAGSATNCTPVAEKDFLAAVDEEARRLGRRHGSCLRNAAGRPDHFVATSSSAEPIGTFESIRWKNDHTILTGPILR